MVNHLTLARPSNYIFESREYNSSYTNGVHTDGEHAHKHKSVVGIQLYFSYTCTLYEYQNPRANHFQPPF